MEYEHVSCFGKCQESLAVVRHDGGYWGVQLESLLG